jgi:hypothetical protein
VTGFLKWVGTVLLLLVIGAVLFKVWQRLSGPPTLDSRDPTERVEAAWEAIKQYGGKE